MAEPDIPNLGYTLLEILRPNQSESSPPPVSTANVLQRLELQPGSAVLLWNPQSGAQRNGTRTVECCPQSPSGLPQRQTDRCWRGPQESGDPNTDKNDIFNEDVASAMYKKPPTYKSALKSLNQEENNLKIENEELRQEIQKWKREHAK